MRAFLFLSLLLVSIAAATASTERFIYGDTTHWTTYSTVPNAYFGPTASPVLTITQDRNSITEHLRTSDGNVFIYSPVRSQPYTCVGSGCARTPYLYAGYNNRYGCDYDNSYGNYNQYSYGTFSPGVIQAWPSG